MQTVTLEDAAALIANKYGWHEGTQHTLLKQLLNAAKDGTLIVRHPHTDLPYHPKECCEYYERVSVSDLNRFFEAAGVPWRLDNGGETADRLFETEWWNLYQVLAWVYLGDRELVREGAVMREDVGFAMRLIVEAENRAGARYPSFTLAQEALIEALQARKLTAYGLENGGGDLKEIPALLWADLKFWWDPDHAGPRDCFRLGASRWVAIRIKRKDILALWPDLLDQPDDQAPAEEEPAVPAASHDTAASAATSNHRANPFPSMDGLTWPEISITFIGTESVRVRGRSKTETFTFEGMGFKHRTSRMAKPNRCWSLLRALAIVSTSDKFLSEVCPTHNLKRGMARLRDQLQLFFQIRADPIVFKKGDGYQPAFNLTIEEHVIREVREQYPGRASEDEGEDEGGEDWSREMEEVPGTRSR